MKSVKCVHPIRANKIVGEFLKEVFAEPVDFALCSVKGKAVMYAAWGDITENEEYEIIIPNWKKADFAHDKGGKYFRKDFVSRCKIAKGFSDVTISLLHEVGHIMTNHKLPQDYSRKAELDQIKANTANNKELTFAYFKLLDETMATDWAINWLSNANNRKIAKKFEKKFWECFAAD